MRGPAHKAARQLGYEAGWRGWPRQPGHYAAAAYDRGYAAGCRARRRAEAQAARDLATEPWAEPRRRRSLAGRSRR